MAYRIKCSEFIAFLLERGFKILPGQPGNNTVMFIQVPGWRCNVVGVFLGCEANGIFDPARMAFYYYGFVKNAHERKHAEAVGMASLGRECNSAEDFFSFFADSLSKAVKKSTIEFDKECCPKCGSTRRNESCLNSKCSESVLYEPNVKDMPKPVAPPPVATAMSPQGMQPGTASDKQKKYIKDMMIFFNLNEDKAYTLSDNQIDALSKEEAFELISGMVNYRASFIKRMGDKVKYPSAKVPLTAPQAKKLKQMFTFFRNNNDKRYTMTPQEIEALSKREAMELIAQMIPFYEQAVQAKSGKPSFIEAVTSIPGSGKIDVNQLMNDIVNSDDSEGF